MALRRIIFNYFFLFFCGKIKSKFYDEYVKEKKKKKRKKNKMFFKIKIAIRSDTHVIKRVSILPSMTIPITVHIYDQLDDVSHIIPLRKSLTKKKNLM